MYCVASCAVSDAAIYSVLAALWNVLPSLGKVFSSQLPGSFSRRFVLMGLVPRDSRHSFFIFQVYFERLLPLSFLSRYLVAAFRTCIFFSILHALPLEGEPARLVKGEKKERRTKKINGMGNVTECERQRLSRLTNMKTNEIHNIQ